MIKAASLTLRASLATSDKTDPLALMLRDVTEDDKWAALVKSAIGSGLVVGFASALLFLW